MYSLSSILRGLKNPKSIARHLDRRYYNYKLGPDSYNPEGTDIFREDWDNLIILDACRYDAFECQSDLSGRLESRISRGARTPEFIRGNFGDRELHDTVYVTANSYFASMQDELDAEFHALYDLHSGIPEDGYRDGELEVVMPETVTDVATDCYAKYPNKRLIVHYLQPHHPFVGPSGRRHSTDQFDYNLHELVDTREWATDEFVTEAYRENLEIVLSEVKRVLKPFKGKTVVSADHGEMLGDRYTVLPLRDYGHHDEIYNEALTKVPWLVTESGDRKQIVPDPPEQTESGDDVETAEERLRYLGYHE